MHKRNLSKGGGGTSEKRRGEVGGKISTLFKAKEMSFLYPLVKTYVYDEKKCSWVFVCTFNIWWFPPALFLKTPSYITDGLL